VKPTFASESAWSPAEAWLTLDNTLVGADGVETVLFLWTGRYPHVTLVNVCNDSHNSHTATGLSTVTCTQAGLGDL